MVPTRAADQSSSIVSAISGVSRGPWKSGVTLAARTKGAAA
jgi:hypothetical protein